MPRLTVRSRLQRADIPLRRAAHRVAQFIDVVPPHQLALLFLDPDVQELGLGFGVLCCCF
jgi:hypothetical protein